MGAGGLLRWLSLDLSSKTGYAIFNDHVLESHGLIESPIKDYFTDVYKYDQLPKSYPENLINSAKNMVKMIAPLLSGVEFVVTEHTEGSKFRFSQRYLEWLHLFLILHLKKEKVPFQYLLNSDWRLATRCYIKFWPQYKQWNGRVGRAKRKAKPTKAGAKVAKIDGKVVSTINQKKLSVILANDFFKLEVKNDNIADALNMGRAAIELGLIERKKHGNTRNTKR